MEEVPSLMLLTPPLGGVYMASLTGCELWMEYYCLAAHICYSDKIEACEISSVSSIEREKIRLSLSFQDVSTLQRR